MISITDLIIFTLLFFTNQIHSSQPSHFIKSITKKRITNNDVTPQQYFQVTHPLPTDNLTPSCTVSVLNHSFGNTYNLPPVTVPYTPPPSTCQWSHAVLEFQAASSGEQYDRIAGIWIDGIELLRTSTAQPTENGIFWNVRKDISKYSSVITKSNLTVSVMLENLINDVFTGVYHVNVSFIFYSVNAVKLPLSGELEGHSLNRKLITVKKNHDKENKLGFDKASESSCPYLRPADLIVPISFSNGIDEGFWFRIQNEFDVKMTNVEISERTYRAVLELYVSFHGDDEFWYMNPPDSYVKMNQLSTGRAHGAYREIMVTIDGRLVGSVVPFPVIFTGGINPLFWEPVVSIGAFNLPSYDIDLTPFLGLLLDNKSHTIGIQIVDGISFWLVDANLHLWLDESDVKAETITSKVPEVEMERENEFEGLDGEFEIEGEQTSEVTGWVNSSIGNLKTVLTEKIKIKNKLKFKNDGTKKELNHKYKRKTKIRITNDLGELIDSLDVKIEYPLKVEIETIPGSEKDTYVMNTKVEQEMTEKFDGVKVSSVLSHKQNCTGSMLVKGNEVLSGSAINRQNYSYHDGLGCYYRKVDVVDGEVLSDESSSNCID
ncbi:peptide-N4-(N-acetyl-beta-glucosaminyl)asparagine amidase A-like [Rutidosis leptorrhynchoides]|uniref:peptide-N4-(N-acetyl-beta- glucosaminyl)asparagine amidase A-like n=1 Tax=Rutidosis leptorrhynchoides TaxID=125765 RepID=UPI003A99AFFF